MMKDQFKYRPWFKLFTTAMVNITINCNLQCRYCFVEQENSYMTKDTLYKVIDLLAENYQKKNEMLGNLLKNTNEKCCLVFFGGEPLLCYDNIVDGVNYAKNKYPNLFEFSITTNGTLLTKDKVDFLKQNDFSIIVSIDGDKNTQDFNRPCKDGSSSFDKVIANIPYILENFPNLLFRSTISKEKCGNIFKDYLFAESLGYSNFYCVPDHLSLDWTEEELNILKEELAKIFEYRTNQFLNNIIPMNFSTITKTYEEILIHDQAVINNCFNELTPNWDDNCGIGLTHIGINWNGDIYACQEQAFKNSKDNLFLIGNIDTGIDEKKHLKLIDDIFKKEKISNLNPEKCENCLAKNLCHLDNCLSCHYYNSLYCQDTVYVSDVICTWKESMLKNCIVQMYILVEQENNLLFQQVLTNRSSKYQEIIEREKNNNVN